ncbi:MAG: hypothetical protein N3F08_00110 [Crenarchaeota archaeon]|nr:hypothetical protein [Thermoproteota archaeon]
MGDSGEPDFEIKITETVTVNGKMFNKDTYITVIEVKYVENPENIEGFERQIKDARTESNRFEDPKWAAPYGVILIITWSPEQNN